jgi:hypothetical protein
MVTSSRKIQTLDDLRAFVGEILCNRDQLELGAFPMTERVLVRGGRPCGVYFCLHGPRNVKFSAIWDAENNYVLFYGSTGERFYKTRLEDELEAAIIAA